MSEPAIAETKTTSDNIPWFDVGRLRSEDTLIHREPFPFFVAQKQLPIAMSAELEKDFPQKQGAGYLPYEEVQCGQVLKDLVDYMTSAEFSSAVGDILGIENLSQYPTMVSISKKLNKRHGTIHTDGKAKVATVLMYLNEEWMGTSDGCLRFLNKIDDIEDKVVPEIPPVFGTLVGFRRTDNSFHGHLPFEGERHVVQVAWVVSEEEKQRKMKRGRLSTVIKKIFGGLDKKVGSGRDKNASHPD